MRLLIVFIWISLLFCCSRHVSAQVEEEVNEEILLSNAESVELLEDLSSHLEQLQHLRRRPLNLQTVNRSELAQLFFLSDQQVEAFMAYRTSSGRILAVQELQVIPGFDLRTVSMMLPYVRLEGASESFLAQLWQQRADRSGWVMATYSRLLQRQSGYLPKPVGRSHYLGSPDRLAMRYRWNVQDRLSISLNTEKDAGEPMRLNRKQAGFDALSTAVYYRDLKKGRHVVIGDYHVQLGQGLMLWTGPQFASRNSLAPALQQSAGIRPHTGMMESKYFRGAAASWNWRRWNAIAFGSYVKQSGRLEWQEDLGWRIRTINHSGLHRTPSEQENRRSFGLLQTGFSLGYTGSGYCMGMGYVRHELDWPYQPRATYYNSGRFSGKRLQQLSLHYQFNWKNMICFGETAHSLGSGWANYHAVSAALGEKFSLNLRYRNYLPSYQQLSAQSYQEQSNLGNEKGYSFHLGFHPSRRWEWISSFDYVQFPMARYRVKSGSAGWLIQSQVGYTWYKQGYLRLRYQSKWFQENFPSGKYVDRGLANVLRQQLRLRFQYKLSEQWTIGNQLEAKLFEKDAAYPERGYLFFQDLIWRHPEGWLQGNIRFSVFQVDSYQARIFTYERDVLYAFSFPSFFRDGIRCYLNQKWRLGKSWECWARYSLSVFRNTSEQGSGLDQIQGNKRSDIRLQLRYSWR